MRSGTNSIKLFAAKLPRYVLRTNQSTQPLTTASTGFQCSPASSVLCLLGQGCSRPARVSFTTGKSGTQRFSRRLYRVARLWVDSSRPDLWKRGSPGAPGASRSGLVRHERTVPCRCPGVTLDGWIQLELPEPGSLGRGAVGTGGVWICLCQSEPSTSGLATEIEQSSEPVTVEMYNSYWSIWLEISYCRCHTRYTFYMDSIWCALIIC